MEKADIGQQIKVRGYLSPWMLRQNSNLIEFATLKQVNSDDIYKPHYVGIIGFLFGWLVGLMEYFSSRVIQNSGRNYKPASTEYPQLCFVLRFPVGLHCVLITCHRNIKTGKHLFSWLSPMSPSNTMKWIYLNWISSLLVGQKLPAAVVCRSFLVGAQACWFPFILLRGKCNPVVGLIRLQNPSSGKELKSFTALQKDLDIKIDQNRSI